VNVGGFSDAVFSVFAAFLAGFPVRDPAEVKWIDHTLCTTRWWHEKPIGSPVLCVLPVGVCEAF